MNQQEQTFVSSNASVNLLLSRVYTRLAVQRIFKAAYQGTNGQPDGALLDVYTQRLARKIDPFYLFNESGLNKHELQSSDDWSRVIVPHVNAVVSDDLYDLVHELATSGTIPNQGKTIEDLTRLTLFRSEMTQALNDEVFQNTIKAIPYYATMAWYEHVGVAKDNRNIQANIQKLQEKDASAISFLEGTIRLNDKQYQALDYYQQAYGPRGFDLSAYFTNFETSLLRSQERLMPLFAQAGVDPFYTADLPSLSVDEQIQQALHNERATSVEVATDADLMPSELPELTGVDLPAISVDLPEVEMLERELVVDSTLTLTSENDPTGLRRKLYQTYDKANDLSAVTWDGTAKAPGFKTFIEPFLDGADDVKAAKRAFSDLQLHAQTMPKLTVKQLDDALNIMTFASNLGYPVKIGNTSGLRDGQWKLDINLMVGSNRAQIPVLHTKPSRMGVYEDFEHKAELARTGDKQSVSAKQIDDRVLQTKLLLAYHAGARDLEVDGQTYRVGLYDSAGLSSEKDKSGQPKMVNNVTHLRFLREDGAYIPIQMNNKLRVRQQLQIPSVELANQVINELIIDATEIYQNRFNKEALDRFIGEWVMNDMTDSLSPNKNERLDVVLYSPGSVREDQKQYVRVAALLHDVTLSHQMNRDRFLDENGQVREGMAEQLVAFNKKVNERIQEYVGMYPGLVEKYAYDLTTFNQEIDVRTQLDALYEELQLQRIGTFEYGFNASLVNDLIGTSLYKHTTLVVDSGMDRNDDGERNDVTNNTVLLEALRVSDYPIERLKGDDFSNEQLIDQIVTFDASTAKSKADFEEGSYMHQILTMVENELSSASMQIPRDSGRGYFNVVLEPASTDETNPYNVRIDDQGIIRWEANRKGVPISGEIGQVFAPDEYGIIHTNFKGKTNYSFAPGARAYSVMDVTAITPEDTIRLHTFDKQMNETIRGVLRQQITSQFIESKDATLPRLLASRNKQSALNRMLYSNKTNGVYGEKLDEHALDFDAALDENRASMTKEMMVAKLKTATQRVHFPKSYVNETNSQVFDKYQQALNRAMHERFTEKDDHSKYIVQDAMFVDELHEQGILNDAQRDYLQTTFANEQRLIIESMVDSDRTNDLIEKLRAHDVNQVFTDKSIGHFIKYGQNALIKDARQQEAIRNATTPGLRRNGYRSLRIVDSPSAVGIFDPYLTGQGGSQGSVQFLADGATVDAETGRITPSNTETRTAVMASELFENAQYDPYVRQMLSGNAFLHAIGVDTETNVMYAPFYGFNFNDAMIISKTFAERNQIFDEDGQLRPLGEGDKLSDTHGNKGVISVVIDADWTEEEAREKNLYKEWLWFNQNSELDMVASSFAPVSRMNAGIFREGLNAPSDINVPVVDETTGEVQSEVLTNGMAKMSIMVLKQTADKQTKLYEASGEGRKFSGQGVWVSQAAGADELVNAIFTASAQTKDMMHLREYLNVLGLDYNEDLQLRVGFENHEGEHRKVHRITNFTTKESFIDMLNTSGGILELPFAVKNFGMFTDNPEKTDVVGETNQIAILPPNLRAEISFTDDGETKLHEYTKFYTDIYKGVSSYYTALNARVDGLTEASIREMYADDEVVRERLLSELTKQTRDIEKAKENVQQAVKRLQEDVYNRLFDPDNNGKHGYLRDVLGRKVMEKSATAVMTPDPRLDINQVRIGEKMAKQLGVQSEDKLIIWRDPLLKTGGMRMVKVLVDSDATVGVAVNPSAPGPMGGDFDGDSIAVMPLPKVYKNKEEQAAFVDRMYRRLGYETNLIDYSNGQKDGKYSLYLEASGMDIATAEKLFNENPERYAKALEAKAVIDELLSDKVSVTMPNGEEMVVPNNREVLQDLFINNDDFYQGFADKYMNAVNTYYHEAFSNGFSTDHTYRFESKEAFTQVTENIVNDGCKGKPENIHELMDLHYDSESNQAQYKAYQKEQQYATAVKTDSTGKAGAVAQKLVVLARSNDALSENMYSALEAAERFTQSVVSLKNKGPIAEKVSNALQSFSYLLNKPNNKAYYNIMGESVDQDHSNIVALKQLQQTKQSLQGKSVDQMNAYEQFVNKHFDDFANISDDVAATGGYGQSKTKRLTVGQLRNAMMKLYTEDLGVNIRQNEVDRVCALLTDQAETEEGSKQLSELLAIAQSETFDETKYIQPKYEASFNSDENRMLYRSQQIAKARTEHEEMKRNAQRLFDALPVNGLKDRIMSCENTFDKLAYNPTMATLFEAAEHQEKLTQAGRLVKEIVPENMKRLYAPSTQFPTLTDEMKQTISDLKGIGVHRLQAMQSTLMDAANTQQTKSSVLPGIMNHMVDYQQEVDQYIERLKENDPVLYARMKQMPTFNQLEDLVNYDKDASNNKAKFTTIPAEVEGEAPTTVYFKPLVKSMDKGLHAFADSIIESNDSSNIVPLFRQGKRNSVAGVDGELFTANTTGKSYSMKAYADNNADSFVSKEKVLALAENNATPMPVVSNASVITNLMFGRQSDLLSSDSLQDTLFAVSSSDLNAREKLETDEELARLQEMEAKLSEEYPELIIESQSQADSYSNVMEL